MFSIVIPAHNESENLPILFGNLKNALATLPGTYEVVFVNNASTDNTHAVAEHIATSFPNLRIITEPVMGYGRAVLAGLAAAKGEYLGIIRSDNQEKPEDLALMLIALAEEGKGLQKAIRATRTNDGVKRIIVSFFFNTLFKLMFFTKASDLNATPKAFTRSFLDRAQLESKDWFIDAEIVLKAERLGEPVRERRIEYLPRLKGKSTVRFHHLVEFLGNMVMWRVRTL